MGLGVEMGPFSEMICSQMNSKGSSKSNQDLSKDPEGLSLKSVLLGIFWLSSVNMTLKYSEKP